MGDIFEQGGDFMYVLTGLAVITLGLILERAWALAFRLRLDADGLTRQVIATLDREGGFTRALELLGGTKDHPVTKVLKAGLLRGNRSDRELQRAMEEAALKAVPQVQKRTTYVAMMANIATLTGLLGTILGLIHAFTGLQEANAVDKQDVLATGISVAMYTTAYGLTIAIPAIFAATWLGDRQGSILESMEESALTLFNYLSTRNRDAARAQGDAGAPETA